jgi:hypothetical protein
MKSTTYNLLRRWGIWTASGQRTWSNADVSIQPWLGDVNRVFTGKIARAIFEWC